jgi:GxxExxY protein
MGFGFVESVYEKCLLIELQKAGIQTQAQKLITVFYGDQIVGDFVVDMIIEDLVIVELKSVRRIVTAHEVQLVNYLTATYKDIGSLINFGPRKVEVKRKMRRLPNNFSER